MQCVIIGDFEVTLDTGATPALVIHHVVRGRDVAHLDAADAAELRRLLMVQQKRIREVGGYRAIFGAGGDVALYRSDGQRACYFNPEQGHMLARLLAEA